MGFGPWAVPTFGGLGLELTGFLTNLYSAWEQWRRAQPGALPGTTAPGTEVIAEDYAGPLRSIRDTINQGAPFLNVIKDAPAQQEEIERVRNLWRGYYDEITGTFRESPVKRLAQETETGVRPGFEKLAATTPESLTDTVSKIVADQIGTSSEWAAGRTASNEATAAARGMAPEASAALAEQTATGERRMTQEAAANAAKWSEEVARQSQLAGLQGILGTNTTAANLYNVYDTNLTNALSAQAGIEQPQNLLLYSALLDAANSGNTQAITEAISAIGNQFSQVGSGLFNWGDSMRAAKVLAQRQQEAQTHAMQNALVQSAASWLTPQNLTSAVGGFGALAAAPTAANAAASTAANAPFEMQEGVMPWEDTSSWDPFYGFGK